MAKLLQLTISKVDAPVFAGFVTAVTVPGSEGEMTLLAEHAPLISILSKGVISARLESGVVETFPIEQGTLEISHNHATILI